MSSFTPFSNSPVEISFRSIFWIPGILFGITILLGFRFYDKSPVASATLLSGESKSFLQAAAELGNAKSYSPRSGWRISGF